jgi:hypothetical protein
MTRQVIGKAVGQNPGFILPAFPPSWQMIPMTIGTDFSVIPTFGLLTTAGSVLSGWWLAFTKTAKVREERLPG